MPRALRNTIPLFLGALILSGSLSACASRYQVMGDYRDLVRDNYPKRVNQATRVVFLIDGLSQLALKRELQRNAKSTIATYFQGALGGSAFTVFPSETYPGISTFLTGLPLDRHLVTGNRILVDGKEVNLENAQPTRELEQLLWDKTIFARLARENRIGVSLSYNFNIQSATAIGADIRAGVAYKREHYSTVDQRTLRSLEVLLKRAETSQWPDFIFVHLVGFDAVSHDQGPDSAEASRYFQWLDQSLAPALALLQQAEAKGHGIQTLLTADHGFEPIRSAVDLRTAARFYLRKFDDYFTPVVAPRYAALYLKTPLAAPALQAGLAVLGKVPLIDGVALRQGEEIRYESRKVSLAIQTRAAACGASNYEIHAFDVRNGKSVTGNFLCPEALEAGNQGRMERIIALQLAAYFQAKTAPDAVLFAASGVSFVKTGLGQHGGLSARELEVPLLVRGLKSNGPIALRRVLSEFPVLPAGTPGSISRITPAAAPPAPRLGDESFPVRRQVTLGTPSGISWLTSEADSDAASPTPSQDWTSGFEPGIAIEYSEKWSRRWGWLGRYQMSFTEPDAVPLTRHEFSAGPFYRHDDSFAIHTLVGASQEFLACLQTPGALCRAWIPELTIGSPFRLLTLPIGDLGAIAELSAFLPQHSEKTSSRAGYRETITLSFDQSVRTWDVLSWFGQVEQIQLPVASGRMRERSLKVGVSYRIAL